ncbi:MAG: DUF3467 domain-containing protein [Bacteroidales bacterium]|nr:DUF3467 domain-containing protein [Bacteroidales bacterium]
MENQIEIELSEEVAQGIYTNLAVITHSSSEFVLDFVRMMPGVPKAQVKTRLVMSPENAKRLLFALGDNIGKFEGKYDEIRLHDEGGQIPTILGVGGKA